MNVSALILTLMLAVTLAFSAAPAVSVAQLDSLTPEETVVEIVETLEGTLAEITEEGLLLETDFMGPVLVKLGEETVLDSFASLEELLPGCVIAVDYNGMMTRSIPAQITAARVSKAEVLETLQGTLVEITEEGLLMETGFMGPVLVKLGEETVLDGFASLEELLPGRVIAVDYNGMMTRSIPAQITADRVTSYQLTGTVTEVLENAFMLETQTHGPVQVNIDVEAGMTLPEVNAQVTVTFNGAMTMSLPAQVGAWIVE